MGVTFKQNLAFVIGKKVTYEVEIYNLYNDLEEEFAFPMSIIDSECFMFEFRNRRLNWVPLIYEAQQIQDDSNEYNAGLKWLVETVQAWLEQHFEGIKFFNQDGS